MAHFFRPLDAFVSAIVSGSVMRATVVDGNQEHAPNMVSISPPCRPAHSPARLPSRMPAELHS
jgi:hypothetical protein